MALNISSRDVVAVIQRTGILLIGVGVIAGIVAGIYWYARLRPDRFMVIEDQQITGRFLQMKRVTLPKDGFLRVLVQRDYPPGDQVLAQSGVLRAGTYRNMNLEFFMDDWISVGKPRKLIAQFNPDVDGDKKYSDLDSDQMLDERGIPIEKIFLVNTSDAESLFTCDEGLSDDFSGEMVDRKKWDVFVEDTLDGTSLHIGIAYGPWRRLLSKRMISGDFSLKVRYLGFSADNLFNESQEVLTRTAVFFDGFIPLGAGTWHVATNQSYIDGTIEGAPAGQTVQVPSDSPVTFTITRVGSRGEVTAQTAAGDFILAQYDDIPQVPGYIGIVVEDKDAVGSLPTAIVDDLSLSCPQ